MQSLVYVLYFRVVFNLIFLEHILWIPSFGYSHFRLRLHDDLYDNNFMEKIYIVLTVVLSICYLYTISINKMIWIEYDNNFMYYMVRF